LHRFARLDDHGGPIAAEACVDGHPLDGVVGRWDGMFFVWSPR
jgi:hypothetical protein